MSFINLKQMGATYDIYILKDINPKKHPSLKTKNTHKRQQKPLSRKIQIQKVHNALVKMENRVTSEYIKDKYLHGQFIMYVLHSQILSYRFQLITFVKIILFRILNHNQRFFQYFFRSHLQGYITFNTSNRGKPT